MKIWKKCIVAVLVAALCVLTISTVLAEVDNFINADWDKEYTLGDLDDNGNINTDDLILMRKHIAGLVSEDDIVVDAADIDINNNVNTDDLVALRKMIAGLI